MPRRTDRPKVLVRGLGDVGSAVAWRLFQAGWPVTLHDAPGPAALRRGMALADAAFDRTAALDGVTARLAEGRTSLHRLLAEGRTIPVVTWSFERLLTEFAPSVLVDARMRKRSMPEVQRGLAPLTIGLGPNFVAGETTDLVVETSWDGPLGAIIRRGPALPLNGEPRPIAGVGRERCVYAPRSGRFRTTFDIGATVARGDVLAAIDGLRLAAPLAGRIRGLVRDGVPVGEGDKVIEIDPRGTAAVVYGLGERPRQIAEGVLRAIAAGADGEPLPRPDDGGFRRPPCRR